MAILLFSGKEDEEHSCIKSKRSETVYHRKSRG